MPSATFQGTSRGLLLTLSAAFIAAATWAYVSPVDIVVSAAGKVVPASLVRVAQSAESGVVSAIRVRDGDVVGAGDVLVELEPLPAAEDAKAAQSQVERLRLQLRRIDAELSGRPFLATDTSILSDVVSEEHTLRRLALAAALSEAQAGLNRALAEAAAVKARLDRATQLLPLVRQQWGMQQELMAQGFVSRAAVTDKERELVDAEQEVRTQSAALQSAEAAVEQARLGLSRIQAEYRRQLAVERTEVAAGLAVAEAESAKREHRLQQTAVTAPVAGTVNALSTLSAGQVVAAGQTLLTLVPAHEKLRVEAWLRNEDAAFVAPGMPAKVKVAAYPFQKYGWIEAEVSWLGVDAETPEAMRNAQGEPLFYRVRLELRSQQLERDGRTFDLRPGLQVAADIHIGQRTVLEYLTSPMRKVLLEAARER